MWQDLYKLRSVVLTLRLVGSAKKEGFTVPIFKTKFRNEANDVSRQTECK
jgi:hypothetical protein